MERIGVLNKMVILYGVGLGAICWGLACLFKSRIASNWPSVPGILRSCEIKKTLDIDVGSMYRLHIRYSYRVDNRHYQGKRLAYGYSASKKYAEHAALYEILSMAQALKIRYNPSNPADSVLIGGLNPFIVRIIIFGLMWTLFVLGFTIYTPFMSWPTDWNPVLQLIGYFLIFGTFTVWVFTRNTDAIMLERLIDLLQPNNRNHENNAARTIWHRND